VVKANTRAPMGALLRFEARRLTCLWSTRRTLFLYCSGAPPNHNCGNGSK